MRICKTKELGLGLVLALGLGSAKVEVLHNLLQMGHTSFVEEQFIL